VRRFEPAWQRIGSLESSSLHGAIPDLIALARADN
jgi:hypothetical protein